MGKIVLLCDPMCGAGPMNVDVDGKLEIVYPVFDERGYPIYEGSDQFVQHFLRSDKRVKLVGGMPVTTHVTDGTGDSKIKTFWPHAMRSHTVWEEDKNGDEIENLVWEWTEQREGFGNEKALPDAPVDAPAVTTGPRTKATILADMKAKYEEKFGSVELFETTVSEFRVEIEKPTGEFDKKEFPEIMKRLKAGLAA